MEFVWNLQSRTYVEHFFAHNQGQSKPLFILLIGPEWVGKRTFLNVFAEKVLGASVQTDYLRMRDCSNELGKSHSLQVETPSTQKTIELENGAVYENRGVRELNSWLQQSAFGGKKLVFIENLERMTNAAMNAFLKACEEPLPNRFIFASVSSEKEILPTILSRALLVRFNALSVQEMQDFFQQIRPGMGEDLVQLLSQLSGGRPGSSLEFLQVFENDVALLGEVKRGFQLLKSDGNWGEKLTVLKKIAESWMENAVVDALIAELVEAWDEKKAKMRIEYKKMKRANISDENMMRYAVLS